MADKTEDRIIEYAQGVIDSIQIANEYGDKYNAVAPLTATFNSYSRLYERFTGKRLIVVNGKVEEETE